MITGQKPLEVSRRYKIVTQDDLRKGVHSLAVFRAKLADVPIPFLGVPSS
jgi:hypothetical protein